MEKRGAKGEYRIGTENSPSPSILKIPVHNMDIFIMAKKIHDSYIDIMTSLV